MDRTYRVDDPFTGDLACEVPMLGTDEAHGRVDAAHRAQTEWATTPVGDRVALCDRFLEAFETRAEQVALDLTKQMGKPLAQARGEVRGMAERARIYGGDLDAGPTSSGWRVQTRLNYGSPE